MISPTKSVRSFLWLLLIFAHVPCNAAPVQSISPLNATGLDLSLSAASQGYTFFPGSVPVWGDLQAGGYVEFDVAVAAAGNYALTVYYSTDLANQSANILINGSLQKAVELPSTRSWSISQDSGPVTLSLPAGTLSMTLAAASASPAFNIQGLILTPVASSAAGPVLALSSTAPTSLDITLSTASGGYTLYPGNPSLWGNLQTNGFLEYTVSSTQAGIYSFVVDYSTTLSGMTADVAVDNSQVGIVNLPITGSWSSFHNSPPVTLSLPAGTSTIRIAAVGQNPAFNIEGMTFAPLGDSGSGSASGSYPFAGTSLYVNAYSVSAQNLNACASIFPASPQLMTKIATQPQAVWFGNWNTNVESDAANLVLLAEAQKTIPTIVVYNIPDRDCAGGYSSGGVDYPAYKAWVQALAQGLGTIRAAVILEPDALSQIKVCNLTTQQQQDRYSLLQYAVSMFNQYSPNASVYIDAGHSDDSIEASDMAQRLQNAGVASAAGFALNISYYGTTASNTAYGESISTLLNNQHFVVDTGRNGNGPTSDAQWCNPSGRALGTPPQGFSSGLVDAYLWVKNPGESDGTCNGGPAAGQFFPVMACTLAKNAAW